MSEKAAEPTIASHITPFEMGLPPDKKHVRLSTKELDLLKNVLAGPPELQGDGVHSLSRDNKRVQENAFRTGLPPDGQDGLSCNQCISSCRPANKDQV